MPERSCFRTPFESQSVKYSKTVLKFERQLFDPHFSSVWDESSWKTSLLERSVVSGRFANTLTANHKYSCHNTEKFQQPVQMQLSKKTNSCLLKFYHFLEIYIKIWVFGKKTERHSLNNSEIIDSKKQGYLNAWKVLFQNTLQKPTG